jgi:hypothetical protein
MEINGIPIIFIIVLVVFVLAAVVYAALRRNNSDAHLYDKRWKVYNPEKPSRDED